MASVKINENTLVEVIKNATGLVGYAVDGKRRVWEANAHPVKKIPMSELEIIMSDLGCYNMLTGKNPRLLIKNNSHREYLGLDPLGEIVTYDVVEELLKNRNIDKIEQLLSEAEEYDITNTMDLFVESAIKLEIMDITILTMIQRYTGKDVEEVIKSNLEDKKEVKKKK